MIRLPISALCISAAASLFAYLTDQPLFLIFGVPLAMACGWAELQDCARREDQLGMIEGTVILELDEDEALAQRLAAFRKALHG